MKRPPSRRPAPLSSRLGELALLALLAAVALLVMPVHADAFALPKRMAGGVLGLASLLLLWPRLSEPERWCGAWSSPGPMRSVLPLAALVTASWAWSDHRLLTGEAVADFLIGAACLVGWSLALPERSLRRALDFTIVLGSVLAALVVAQSRDWFDPFVFHEVEGRTALTSLAGGSGDLAAFLVLPLLVAQARLGTATGRGGRVLQGAALLVLAGGLLTTRSLTPLAAAILASAVFWWLRGSRRRFLAVLAGIVLVALGAFALVPELRERVEEKREALSRGDLNDLLTGRLDGWRVAWEMWRDHPWGGIGWGAYRAEFAPVKLELTEAGEPFYRQHQFPTFQNAHNEYLETGAELGLLGLAALAWALVELVRVWSRIRGEPAEHRALAWAGLMAIALLSLVYFPFRVAVTAYPYLAFLAWGFRAADPGQETS